MYKVAVTPDVAPDGEVIAYPDDVLLDKMGNAGWTDDPGEGKAVLTPLGYEIVSPIPVAPPVGYVSEPTIMDRLNDMLTQRLRQLRGDDLVEETEAEANDFDVPDPEDYNVRSIYEIELIPEAPALPRQRVQDEGKDAQVSPAGSKPDGDVGSQV